MSVSLLWLERKWKIKEKGQGSKRARMDARRLTVYLAKRAYALSWRQSVVEWYSWRWEGLKFTVFFVLLFVAGFTFFILLIVIFNVLCNSNKFPLDLLASWNDMLFTDEPLQVTHNTMDKADVGFEASLGRFDSLQGETVEEMAINALSALPVCVSFWCYKFLSISSVAQKDLKTYIET